MAVSVEQACGVITHEALSHSVLRSVLIDAFQFTIKLLLLAFSVKMNDISVIISIVLHESDSPEIPLQSADTTENGCICVVSPLFVYLLCCL